MKAAVLVETGKIDIREMDRPILGPDDLLIETTYAGVCGSDLHAFRGKHPSESRPSFWGTSWPDGGRMRRRRASFRPGDRVTVMPLVACGTCRMCRMSRENIC